MEKLTTEWQLDKYFYSSIEDENLKKDLESYKNNSDKFIEKYKGKIGELNEEEFLKFLEDLDLIDAYAEKVAIYLGLASSLDTQNQSIQKEQTKVFKIFSQYSEKFLFIEEEYKQMGFRRFESLASLSIMKPFRNFLLNTAKSIQYILTEAEEAVCIKFGTAYSNNLYEELVTSFEYELFGEKLTEDQVRMLRENQDRDTRRKAWETLAEMYQRKYNQIVLGNLYSTICKDNVADVELRKYKTVLSQRNISEEVSDETVDTLLKKVSDNYSLYQKFLLEKVNILGLDKLETHDIFAPFPAIEDLEGMSFEEGWKLYKRTIEKVDPKLSAFSDEMLEGGRISVFPKNGKSNGAYAQYAKRLPEFVLLNWANTYSDVTTLAHELGHAFHGNLSKEQKAMVYSTPLILAETASIFNETLMFETILENITDKGQRAKLICGRLDDIFGTIFRQVTYVLFEKRCHESFKNNEPLTYDDYNAMWTEEMSKLFGPDVNLEENLVKQGWSTIPHIFHTPFYCYTYAFGNIISLNLYQNYKDSVDKKEFIEKYHKLLSSGGSDTPENILNDIFGIKFDDKFYSTAFLNIEQLIYKLND